MLTTRTLHKQRRHSGKRDSKCQKAQCRRKVGRFEVRGEPWEAWQGTGEDGVKRLSLARLPQPGVVRELCDLEGEDINRFCGSI